MRVTTRTRYAIRALYDLAFHRRGQAAQSREIAERQQIPPRYLEQILRELRQAGIVEARRGPRGGYALARAPETVSLADVLRAVRGPLEQMFALEDTRTQGGRGARRRAEAQPDVPGVVWGEVTGRLVAVLESVTLQDLVSRAEAAGVPRATAPPTMYFI